MKRVLVSDSMAPEVAEILGNAPGIKVDVKTGLKPEELNRRVEDWIEAEVSRLGNGRCS